MRNVKCKLLVHSDKWHLQSIYTGLRMLHRSGEVDIRQVVEKKELVDPAKPPALRNIRKDLTQVVLDNGTRLCYDLYDGPEVDKDLLDQTDYYFKRSYSPESLQGGGPEREKIHPLGLYYPVYPAGIDPWGIHRAAVLGTGMAKLKRTARCLRLLDLFEFVPRVSNMQERPQRGGAPRVLYMTRLWDPHSKADRSEEKVAERQRINDMRAACVRQLRQAFGPRFQGGVAHTPYAKEHYRDVLVGEAEATAKARYVASLRSHSICVTTTGLHGSIGAKFAEYVAFSRAIVSQKPNVQVPGGLQAGTHYLPFESAEQCVEQVRTLVEDRARRERMMESNARYYRTYLRPDALVANTLTTAFEDTTDAGA